MKHLLFALTALIAAPAQADMLDDILDASVRTGWRAADGSHVAALQFDLAPGWKTYWRQPGDAGIPPEFDWTGSQNLSAARVVWPVPKVTWDEGMRSVGYDGRVILPVIFQPKSAGDVTVSARVQIGVCADICIPVTLNLKAVLPAQGQPDRTISTALNNQAKVGRGQAVCVFAPAADGMSVTLSMPMPRQGAEAAAVEIDIPGLWIDEPKLEKTGGRLQISANIMTPSGQPIGIDRRSVTTSIFAGTKGVEYTGCVGG